MAHVNAGMTAAPRGWSRQATVLLGLAVLGIMAVAASEMTLLLRGDVSSVALAASERMARGLQEVAACRAALAVPLNAADDINRTGLVGWPYTALTTTIGNLESKRSTTNPQMAGLIARLLAEAGVQRGDVVAIGASGSFPGLILASVCAAETLEAEPLVIYSFGASQWGANDPRFTWLEMENCLIGAGILHSRTAAVSLGGDRDAALELSSETRDLLRGKATGEGLSLLEEQDLTRNVAMRMALYHDLARGRRIAAFVNVGGTWADLGLGAEVLQLEPGLSRLTGVPSREKWGVLHAMSAEGVPVIHLLNIRGLTTRYGLPWDPSPLPDSKGPVERVLTTAWVAIASSYLALVAASLALWWRTRPAGA